jgi:hypothetical protein
MPKSTKRAKAQGQRGRLPKDHPSIKTGGKSEKPKKSDPKKVDAEATE